MPAYHALRRQRWNVLLIGVDTLRADRMGWAGYHRHLTPHLDRLAARSVVFEHAYAPANRTSLTFSALFTGHYPSELHRDQGYFIRLKPDNPFIAARFRKAGYKTLASSSHFAFDPYYGLHNGFDVWQLYARRDRHEMNRLYTGTVVTHRAIRLLDHYAAAPSTKRARPFYLFLHYLDPHLRYLYHSGKGHFGSSRADRYDGEILYTDQQIGILLHAMKKRGLLKSTVIALTSDHGECLGEHGTRSHGRTLHQCELRVPLLLHVPGLGGRRIARAVSLIDLPRTLLDLVGIPVPPDLKGVSWLPWLRSGLPLPPRPIYAEVVRGPHSRMSRTLIAPPWKLIEWTLKNRTELFHLGRDPGELHDLTAQQPSVSRCLRQTLAAFRKSALRERPAVRFR